MSELRVTVVVPTLAGDEMLAACLESLGRQTFRAFQTVVIDNGSRRLARRLSSALPNLTILENSHNLGFGAAVNQGFRLSRAPFLATLNDDAAACPHWLEALLDAIESRSDAGMCASQVRLAGENRLDSAGMLIAADGSSKQRGRLEPPENFSQLEEVLLPSASAALYRRAMLEEIGGFDEDFFFYSEDTDLGLRARWAGWKCLYVPAAVVEHHYSYSAGRASALKAYCVERNRLFLLAKNFPAGALLRAPFAALARYFWHFWFMTRGKGAAAEFRAGGNSALKLVYFVARAHGALLLHLPRLWKKRRAIRRAARIRAAEFRRLLAAHAITTKEVASL